MDLGNVTASVGVGEIHETVIAGAIASRKRVGDGALVNVGGASIEIGRRAIRNCGQRQVEGALCGPASSEKIAAIGDSQVVQLGPSHAAIQALPNALINRIRVDVPGVHFSQIVWAGAIWHHRDLPAINVTTAWRNCLGWTEG